MTAQTAGPICFGLVIGWVTYRSLRRRQGVSLLTDIATVLGAIGGAAVTALFKTEDSFGLYSIGLAVGFFAYFIVNLLAYGRQDVGQWMGD